MSFVLPDETACERKMISDLLVCNKLSPWESNFIKSVNNWTGNFTQRQAEKIVLIWGNHIAPPLPPELIGEKKCG